MNNPEVLIIGGGPAGAAAATYLAKNGVPTLIVEQEKFPRFHIGESLLPGSTEIFKELGVFDALKETAYPKVGGMWFYDNTPVYARFADCSKSASFSSDPSAFFVERGSFDELLLNNAEKHGAQVIQECTASLTFAADRSVTSATLTHKDGTTETITPRFVIDCSGYHSVITHSLHERDNNRIKRMGIFGQFEAEYLHPDLKEAWFIGQIIYDGWIWLIPLSDRHISIGLVTSNERFADAATRKQEFFDEEVMQSDFIKKYLASPVQKGEIMAYPKLGYSSQKFYGPNWVVCGDAAFFVDPCYSSGVHLALESGKSAATAYLSTRDKEADQLAQHLVRYDTAMRRDEKIVRMFVESFYLASKSRLLRRLIPIFFQGFISRDFIRVAGGDFTQKPYIMYLTYYFHKFVSLFSRDKKPAWAQK